MRKGRKIGRKAALWLAVAGLGGGVLCGFLGSGGGILFVFALTKLLPRTVTAPGSAAAEAAPSAQAAAEFSSRDIFAMTVLTVIPLTAATAVMYRLLGVQSGPLFSWSQLLFLLPAALGGGIGAWLLDKLSTKALKKLFGGILVVGGLLMVLR